MMWSSKDGNLDIGLGINWRAWGLGVTTHILGDINMFYEHLGPLYFTVTYWSLKDSMSLDKYKETL